MKETSHTFCLPLGSRKIIPQTYLKYIYWQLLCQKKKNWMTYKYSEIKLKPTCISLTSKWMVLWLSNVIDTWVIFVITVQESTMFTANILSPSVIDSYCIFNWTETKLVNIKLRLLPFFINGSFYNR